MVGEFLPCAHMLVRVEDTAVAQIDLRALHEPLPHVLVPREQAAHHVGLLQCVQVAPHGFGRYTHGGSDLRSVPDLGVVVGEHGPETAQGGGTVSEAEQAQVALQEGADELFAPTHAVLVVRCQERP